MLNAKKYIFLTFFLNILRDATSHLNLNDLRGKGKKRPGGGLKDSINALTYVKGAFVLSKVSPRNDPKNGQIHGFCKLLGYQIEQCQQKIENKREILYT